MENNSSQSLPSSNQQSASSGFFRDVLEPILSPLASLKLTVVIMALGILLVFFGTLAQTDFSEHEVGQQIFRSFIAWIEFKWFFPPKIFPGVAETVHGGFYFPGGWIIGGVMAINLLAAHGLRFRTQATGLRLFLGLGVLAGGILLTYLVIAAGPDKDTLIGSPRLQWEDIHHSIKIGLGLILAAICVYLVNIGGEQKIDRLATTVIDFGLAGMFGYLLVDDISISIKLASAAVWLIAHCFILHDGQRRAERTVLLSCGALLAGLLGYLIFRQDEQVVNAAGLRILWQLLKGFAAGLDLLIGCVMVFKKRAGVTLLHAGLLLMMSNELVVYNLHEENRISLFEGQSKNYVESNEYPELSFVAKADATHDDVFTIPFSLLTPEKRVSDPELPFDVELVEYWDNSRIAGPFEPALSAKESPATTGVGKSQPLRPLKKNRLLGFDSATDFPAAFVRILDKKDHQDLGVYLVSYQFDMYQDTPGPKIQNFTLGGQSYFVNMRPKRSYRPYTIKLLQTRREDYPGTNTPKIYESIIEIKEPTQAIDREERIFMNNPLRYSGETFYQSGHDKDEDTGVYVSTLQVVTNVGWMIPYVGCMIVVTGMGFQFIQSLVRFIRRRDAVGRTIVTAELSALYLQNKPKDAKTTELPPPLPQSTYTLTGMNGTSLRDWVIFGAAVLSCLAWFIPRSIPPTAKPDTIDLYRLGQIPVVYEGRTKPLDSVARSKLRTFAQKEEVEDAVDLTQKAPAMRWLMELITHPDTGEKFRIFRIDDEVVQNVLRLEPYRRYQRYSAAEIASAETILETQAELAHDVPPDKRNDFHKKIIDLYDTWQRYKTFRDAIVYVEKPGAEDNLTTLLHYAMGSLREKDPMSNTPKLIPPGPGETEWRSMTSYSAVPWLKSLAEGAEKSTLLQLFEQLLKEKRGPFFDQMIEKELIDNLAKQQLKNSKLSDHEAREAARQKWQSTSPEKRESELDEQRLRYVQNSFLAIIGPARTQNANKNSDLSKALIDTLKAYRDGKTSEIEPNLTKYLDELSQSPPQDYQQQKNSFESYFNYQQPFGIAIDFYKIAMVLTACAWLGWFKSFRRAAFAVLVIAFLIHTFALAVRIYLSGRPPVTNLYSLSVYIGWGAVAIGLGLESLIGRTLGCTLAALGGIITLQIADYLAIDSDTLGVMQAVLDTNFWLATHVVCISTGYTVTYASALLGMIYIFRGLFTTSLTPEVGREIYRMMYGITCAAILLSFFGTVLGGLWADDSWGRFWGWDPKENGALIIVLWNTLVLHARWDGWVKERGFAVLSVFGGVVTSWSYFGVNQLGLGHHSYGFTEGVVKGLAITVGVLVLTMLLGCLPRAIWFSKPKESRSAA